MDWALKQRIIRVDASFLGGDKPKRKRGTGLRLESGWVLTSQHILELRRGVGREAAAQIEVVHADPSGEGAEPLSAEVRWRGEEFLNPDDLRAMDAALLWCEGLKEAEGDRIQMVQAHLPSAPCEMAGWPGISPQSKALISPKEWLGRYEAIARGATVLPLQIDGLEPKAQQENVAPLGGISGAPIFAVSGRFQGHLYGLVRKAPREMPDQLFAVSTPALLRRRDFREVLGLEDPPPAHEDLVLSSRRLLLEAPHLAQRLAQAEPSWKAAWEADQSAGGVDGLIAALCSDGDLRKLLETLEALAIEAAEQPQNQDALRRWAPHLTALLAHQFFVGQGRQIGRKSHGLEVPVQSPVYAEAVLAAEHGEPPRYVWRSEASQEGSGGARPALEVPVSELEAGLRVEQRIDDQVGLLIDELLRKDLATPRYLTENQLRIIKGQVVQEQPEVRRVAVRLALKDFCRRENTNRRPYLLIEPFLRQIDEFKILEGFLVKLAELLPELEQVELRGEAIEGLHLEHELSPLWRILGIDKGETT